MPIRCDPDAELTRLNKKLDEVNVQMSAAWDTPSPDMAALEALHYELKNLEYRIAMHRSEEES